MEINYKTRKANTAKGRKDSNRGTRIDIRFDDELYQEINRRAVANGLSFGAQVKLMLKSIIDADSKDTY